MGRRVLAVAVRGENAPLEAAGAPLLLSGEDRKRRKNASE